MKTFTVHATPETDDVENQSVPLHKSELVSNDPAMHFFTQCPKCRVKRAQKEIVSHQHPIFESHKKWLVALAVVLVITVIIITCA